MLESSYYKHDLLTFSASFTKRKIKQIARADSLIKAEKFFYIGFYYIRKLLESIKITDKCKKTSAIVIRYKINPNIEINDFDRTKVFEFIENKNKSTQKLNVKQICDKVIHSYTNMIVTDDSGGLAGFLLTTDKYKNKELWLIPIDSIIAIFNTFGNNYPTKMNMRRDRSGKMIYWLCE